MATLFQIIPPKLKHALFDRGQFRADLTLSRNSPIPAYKKCLREAVVTLNQWFDNGVDINMLVNARAWLIDQVLTLAWEYYDRSDCTDIALLAVGGYGRGELHPESDIDLLILLEHGDYHAHQQHVEPFLRLLWDIGLTVGSSVRSLKECCEQARNDLSIITNLMESRIIAGPSRLYDMLQNSISVDNMWPSKLYLQAKFEEQRKRHRKYNDTEYNLEPDIKSSPGGLRDLHMLGWVVRRHYGTIDPSELVDLGFLTLEEHQLLIRCRVFIWKIRWALHRHCQRCEDRLLFDHQENLAERFGYKDDKGSLAVEQFMQSYFRTVMTIAQLKDLLLQHFDDDILKADEKDNIKQLTERFRIRNNYIETVNKQVFAEYPPAILEMFVLMTRHQEILGARAETIRLLREHRHYVDSDFQTDPRCTRLFLELMRAPYNLTATLRRMVRYGILGRYLPEFSRIIGQMQFDLFHVHTVDAHTLLLIKYLRSFTYKENERQYPIASRVIRKISKPRLLYIAGLYHDIGKGRDGDHSQLGAVYAEKFCRRHGMDNEETSLVVWLVKEHLTLSTTAQRQDISDSEVIQAFARKVGSQKRLDYLYALTVADINATNPLLWNGWRASLLQQLYRYTRQFFKQGIENLPSKIDQVASVKQQTITLLNKSTTAISKVQILWSKMEDSYFIRHEPKELAWQAEGIISHQGQNPLIMVRETHDNEEHGGSKIFIYIPNQPNLFAAMVAALDQLHLLIQDAKIFTSTHNYGLETFTVLERDGSAIGKNDHRIHQIKRHLEKMLTSPNRFPELIRRRTPRQLRHFTREPEVLISTLIKPKTTELSLTAADRPGLLALIGKTFVELGIEVRRAKIATFGEKVEDRFIITAKEGDLVSDENYCEKICQKLTKTLKDATRNN
ncbi:MAG: [protein-PII] uridylyltransferase [Endozoicomonas sp. (ex Botrylloides leachii)]|nr:[protein-PII] uridylyltransferase [Endozoicomonas sp. (ex Botrylloides leachii)]